MDYDIPTDLIDKAQIGFREAAGLSSFDRKSIALPSISTVAASISSLDPSPSYLRCKFCQGKLLRGVQSLICIYCGENQKKDLHPDPISFSSTHGYSWLLQSLNFNGSERIGSLAEGSGINGEQSPAEDDLTLSELLDLKISWRDEPEKPESSFNIKTSEHNISLNIGATDFDHFFTKSMSKSALVSDALEEEQVSSKADQIKINEGQESFTSDWNAEFQFADTKTENEKLESVDLFKGAEADLSAHLDVGIGQTESFDFKKPIDDSDPFQVDLFANMSSATFQQNEQLDAVVQAKDGLSVDLNNYDSEHVGGDWFSDGNWQKSSVKDTLNDVSLLNPNDTSTDVVVQAKVGLSGDLNDSSLKNADEDWFSDGNWQKSSVKDTLNDVSLLNNPNDTSTDVVVQAKVGLSGDLNDSSLKNADEDWFSDGNWQKSSVKNTLSDGSLQDNPNDSSTGWFDDTNWQKNGINNTAAIKDVNYTLNVGSSQDNPNDSSTDWFENTNWQKSSANNAANIKDDNYTLNDGSLKENPNDTSTDWFETTNWQKDSTNNTTATVKDDNLFDIKAHANDLIQSEKSDLDNLDKHHSDVTDWFQDSQWAIGGSSSTTNVVVSKDDDDDDDGFGEWNDFTSSTGNKDSFQASWKESGNEKVDFGTSEKMSELSLFQSAVDSPEVDFGNFLQSDIFSGEKNPNDTPAVYDIFSDVSTTIRNANTEAGNNAKGSKNDETTPNATTSSKDDVQMLMSQMHDLSFMLKNELSLPSKPDTSHS